MAPIREGSNGVSTIGAKRFLPRKIFIALCFPIYLGKAADHDNVDAQARAHAPDP